MGRRGHILHDACLRVPGGLAPPACPCYNYRVIRTDTAMITYRELLQQLQQFTHEELNSNVTVYDEGIDEYFDAKVKLVFTTEIGGARDLGHPVIRF